MAKEWSILNWNIRGINDPKKWTAIKNKIEESHCAVLCLQETKGDTFDFCTLRTSVPKDSTDLNTCHLWEPLGDFW